MSKNLFKSIEKALISLQPQGIKGHALKRIMTLTAMVKGMIDKQSCHLNALGSGIENDIDDASREAAAKRFVENKYTDYKLHYLPYLSQVLVTIIAQASLAHGLSFVIDGSQMGKNHVALMLSVVYKKRSIPLYWVIKKGKKGHFPTEMHLELVQKAANILKSLMRKDIPITLLGDGEFDSVDLQKLCRKELGWNYVFRTANDSILHENDDFFQPKSLQMAKEETFVFIPSVDFSKEKYPDVHFLYWHDKAVYDDPLFLISSYDDPFDIIFYYKQRFAIETLFKDLKSRGFNLHKNRLTKALALFNLILIAALGYCLIFAFGQNNSDNKFKAKVLRIHKIQKHEISIFSYGLKLLKYLIKYNRYFSFKLALL
jgi:hypothetical protein